MTIANATPSGGRYNVTLAEVGIAVDSLIDRQLVRRLPDGQLYWSSPAEYLVPLEGMNGCGARADPMGGDVTCHRYRSSWRTPMGEVMCALAIPAVEPVCVLELEWASHGQPAAISTTYLAAHLAEQFDAGNWAAAMTDRGIWPLALPTEPGTGPERAPGAECRPVAVAVELEAPAPAVSRKLRMPLGHPVLPVTVRFDDKRQARPATITAAALRPGMFRIAV